MFEDKDRAHNEPVRSLGSLLLFHRRELRRSMLVMPLALSLLHRLEKP